MCIRDRWTSFIALVVAVLWAPLIGKFASLVAYYQEFSSYLAPPIVGTFLVGLFWKGSTRNGAFAGLMSGLAMSALIMTYKFGFGGVVPFHFLLWVPILLILSVLVKMCIRDRVYTNRSPLLFGSQVFRFFRLVINRPG